MHVRGHVCDVHMLTVVCTIHVFTCVIIYACAYCCMYVTLCSHILSLSPQLCAIQLVKMGHVSLTTLATVLGSVVPHAALQVHAPACSMTSGKA